jgi:Domain of unknown function (DUF4270)
VKKSQFAFRFAVLIISISILFSACRKINEATELGGDLIPVVDNITTFDTTLTVETYNGIFDVLNDSTLLNESGTHFLGRISNDPVFGSTSATIFLELKPPFYKYSFENKKDSLHIDSVVLVLEYTETYGDTTIPQSVNVYEIDQLSPFRFDSTYRVSQNNFTYSNLLGTKTFLPSQLNDTTNAILDTTNNRLRIRLDNSFGQRLLDYDSSASGAYFNDSAFRTKFKGFAIEPSGGGNALMGFNLLGAKTKLAIYYRYDKNNVMNADTVERYFNFTAFSASANYITRAYQPNIISAANSAAQDDLVYIANTPGTFATIKIPGLSGLSNRVVHRAELIMEQVYDASDTLFPVPNSLMLDAYDPAISKFRTIPYDMLTDGQGALTPYYFGGLPFNGLDAAAKPIKIWRFNISRYVQHVVTQTLPVYDLRVFSPYYVLDQYGIPGKNADVSGLVNVNPTVAKGRVKLHGGSPATNPQRMRLRIIYSKL